MKSTDSLNKTEDFDTTTLVQDGFGTYWDQQGESHDIKRFTWKNRNKIEVQVINYGARIVSMKFPDRKGVIEDIVLGFDDLAGYLFYESHYFGATIGRTSHIVRNASLNVNRQEFQLSQNHGDHHLNGGRMGLDKVVWTTHISGKKVIMTHMSQHLSEGYPGDLLVRIIFELSDMNEFRIDIEAFTSLPTVLNISNLTYFNLAGHYKDAEETYKQVVTINADCFLKQENGLPTGEVCNVANFPFDFQVPKVLGKVMGICPGDGFNEYLSVNRGIDQDICFVGRVVHNNSGRVLEIYSNQRCVCFKTANEFGSGRFLTLEQLSKTPEDIKTEKSSKTEQQPIRAIAGVDDEYLEFLNTVHSKLEEHLQEDKENNYSDLRNLILKMGKQQRNSYAETPNNTPEMEEDWSKSFVSDILGLVLSKKQKEYLKGLYEAVSDGDDDLCNRLKQTVEKLLSFSISSSQSNTSVASNTVKESAIISSEAKQAIVPKPSTPKLKSKEIEKNKIPVHYQKKNKIVGKDRKVYGMHSGVALQTQNYPCSETYRNFPSSVLYPGENYKHTIIYKFWIRAGNPSKWVKKNNIEKNKQEMERIN